MLIHRCFSVGPPSATVVQQSNDVVQSVSLVCLFVLHQDIFKVCTIRQIAPNRNECGLKLVGRRRRCMDHYRDFWEMKNSILLTQLRIRELSFFFLSAIIIIIFARFLNSPVCFPREIRQN